VLEGRTGYVVPGGDVDALTTRLVGLLLDPALRARLGGRGRAWVTQDWRWDTSAERLGALLDPDQPLPPGGG
jgi:phosphatidylinositol alpha-1,6-mannosyltransferase